MVDKLKFALAIVLVIAGVAGFYILEQHGMPLVLRVLSVLAGLAAGAGVAWLSTPGREFGEFVREAIVETKKVVWPTRKETTQMTGIVFAFVVVMAIFLWLTDKSLEWVVYDLILGWK